MPQNQIINTYMKIKEYYNETIETLKKRGKIIKEVITNEQNDRRGNTGN